MKITDLKSFDEQGYLRDDKDNWVFRAEDGRFFSVKLNQDRTETFSVHVTREGKWDVFKWSPNDLQFRSLLAGAKGVSASEYLAAKHP